MDPVDDYPFDEMAEESRRRGHEVGMVESNFDSEGEPVSSDEPGGDSPTPLTEVLAGVEAESAVPFDAPEERAGLPKLPVLHEPAAQLQDWDLMLALAAAAGRTRTDLASAGLCAAMVPLALRLVPTLDRALWPALPTLVRGSMALAVQARRRPDGGARRLALIPLVLRRTVASLARDAMDGRPLPGHEHLLQRLDAQARRVLAGVAPVEQPRTTRRPASAWSGTQADGNTGWS